jgi:transposase
MMDNTSYHSVIAVKTLASNAKRAIVEARISGKMGLVQLTRLKNVHYELDAASACNHIVARLPLYHCQYNPIELVWAEVTYMVADKFHSGFQVLTF